MKSGAKVILAAGAAYGAWWIYNQMNAAGQAAGDTLNQIEAIPGNIVNAIVNPSFDRAVPTDPLAQSGNVLNDVVIQPAIDLFSGTPRGIRNNNPTNIKWVQGQVWQGQTGNDGTFTRFNTPAMGIRAAFKIWQSYARQGYTTPAQIVAHWANVKGLNLTNYLAVVSSVSGLPAAAMLDTADPQSMIDFAQGVIAAENGLKWADYYPLSTFQAAWSAI